MIHRRKKPWTNRHRLHSSPGRCVMVPLPPLPVFVLAPPCRLFAARAHVQQAGSQEPGSTNADLRLNVRATTDLLWHQHAEDGTLDDAIVIARQSLETDPRCCGDVRATPVFFLDAQSPLDNTVLAMELSTPYDNDVPGLVLAYGRLSVRQMSIFLCLIEVKGLGLDEYLFTSGHLQYWRG